MKKAEAERPMRKQYEFRGGVRGKYAARFHQGAIAVVLDPDVANVFTDSESVNRALRVLVEIAGRQGAPKRERRTSKSARGSNPPVQPPGDEAARG